MAVESELLLTEYLLNFEEDNDEECSFETEAISSGVECSDDEDSCTLSVLKETLKAKPKKPVSVPDTNIPHTNIQDSEDTNKPVSKNIDRRERKRMQSKEYRKKRSIKIKSTMEECEHLKEVNKNLTEKNEEMEKTILDLEKQVKYLENVIANESTLSTVLGTIANLSGLSFGMNPLKTMSQKRKRVEGVNDENEPQTKKQNNGGMCLHLKPGRMTLEFCPECNESAKC